MHRARYAASSAVRPPYVTSSKTRAAARRRSAWAGISLPASESPEASAGQVSPQAQANDEEVGGVRGRAALNRLRNAVGRVESSWRPANAEEGFEIVRRRLFEPLVAHGTDVVDFFLTSQLRRPPTRSIPQIAYFGLNGLPNVRWLAHRYFDTEEARALLGGAAAGVTYVLGTWIGGAVG